ncbi:MAG: type II toxin-antitoxin system HigB family toxin [Pseudomonadales bacterium]
MRIINPQDFDLAAERFPQKAKALNQLRLTLETVQPSNSADLHNLLPSMKRFGNHKHCYRFDVGGRKGLRMVALVRIQQQTLKVEMIGTHDEYDDFTLGY